jgi:hypothetical protein
MNTMSDKNIISQLVRSIPYDDTYYKVITLDDYEFIRSDIVNKFRVINSVVGIYEFGKVGCPGMSDLDLAIVFNDNTTQGSDIKVILDEIYSSNKYYKVLGGGTVMIFSESCFTKITLLDDIVVQCLYGKELTFNFLSKEELKNRKICQVIDWLPERLLALISYLKSDAVLVNRVVGYLYSLTYTYKILRELGLKDKRLEIYIYEVETLRDQWLNSKISDNRNNLIKLIYDVFCVVPSVMQEFSKILEDRGLIKPNNKTLEENKIMLSTSKGYTYQDITNNCVLNHNLLEKSTTIMPISRLWCESWYVYSRPEGYISNKIKEQVNNMDNQTEQYFEGGLIEFMIGRIQLCNQMADYLNILNINRGLYKFGWFLH